MHMGHPVAVKDDNKRSWEVAGKINRSREFEAAESVSDETPVDANAFPVQKESSNSRTISVLLFTITDRSQCGRKTT